MVITKESVIEDVVQYGAIFVNHREAAAKHITNLPAWGRLLGYDPSKYVMTLRPHIIHPDGWEWQEKWKHTAHELAHFVRQPKSTCGLWRWVIRYGLSQRFRAEEELHGHLVDLFTGRAPRDIPLVVEKMREWYKLTRVDPNWMIDWLSERFSTAPEGYR